MLLKIEATMINGETYEFKHEFRGQIIEQYVDYIKERNPRFITVEDTMLNLDNVLTMKITPISE